MSRDVEIAGHSIDQHHAAHDAALAVHRPHLALLLHDRLGLVFIVNLPRGNTIGMHKGKGEL